MEVREYLNGKGFAFKVTGSEATMNCPFCDDKEGKFAVSLDTGAFKCFHENRCGKTGSFYQLRKELGDEPERQKVWTPPKNYRKPEVKARSLGAESLAWFAGRKITQATLDRFRIRQMDDGRIAFPYYKDGACVNVKYRKLPKEFSQEKDAEPCLFGRDLVEKDATDLVILEGEMDALAAWEYGIAAVSVPGGAGNLQWITGEWDYLRRFKHILLALDGDAAGEAGVSAMVKRLGLDWDLRRVTFPAKDVNDALMAGVNAETIQKCIEDARSLGPEEVKLLRDVDLANVKEPEPGLPCEIPGLTGILGGWRLGELTIHGGESYSGKTTATQQEAMGLLRRFKKVCVCNLEQRISTVVWNMVMQSGHSRDDFLSFYAEDLIFLDLHQTVTVARLLDLMLYVSKRYGAEHFIIDSLGCIAMPTQDYWLKQKEVVGHLARFAKDQDVHVHLVHHLRKTKGGATVEVDHSDLEGSGWIRNLADNVIFYRRIEEADRQKHAALDHADEVVMVDKNRAFGINGSILLAFDRTRRAFEVAPIEVTP